MTNALRLVQHTGKVWYILEDERYSPIHLEIAAVGWSVTPIPYQEFEVECYGKRYTVLTGRSGKHIIAVTDSDGNTVDELLISDGHPAAVFFKKTITFDDGVERVVPIAQTKPTQPY